MNSRPTLLLLPGNMCDERLWDEVMPFLSGWPVERPRLEGQSIAEMAGKCLSDHSGKLVPVGFSMGAIVALAMAEMASDRLAAMGLIGVNADADRPSRAAHRPRQQDAVMAGGLRRIVTQELLPVYFTKENETNTILHARVLDMAISLGPKAFVVQSEALRTRPDYRHVLGYLNVPALLAVGAEDALCPPELHKTFAASMPSSDLHIISGAGHMLPLERPAALGRLLSGWLTKIEKDTLCPTVS